MPRYETAYELKYHHRVVVGIEADSEEAAIEKAEKAFEAGTIWDNAPDRPLLYDDFCEDEGELHWEADEIDGDAWPEPDASVAALRRHNASEDMLGALCAARDELEIWAEGARKQGGDRGTDLALADVNAAIAAATGKLAPLYDVASFGPAGEVIQIIKAVALDQVEELRAWLVEFNPNAFMIDWRPHEAEA